MNSWTKYFKDLETQTYYQDLMNFVKSEYETQTVYPPFDKMFNAFNLTPYDKIKVVIVGQDPYHEPNQAMGLAFSVPNGVTLPPSLKNIYKELQNEYNKNPGCNGDLTYLATQGVLLLNAYLTVRKGEPLSHKCKNYENLLKDIIKFLNNAEQPIVFMLWGGFARKLAKFITNSRHLVLQANHPSPLSANRGGWFGCNHFKQANNFLIENGIKPIEWFR